MSDPIELWHSHCGAATASGLALDQGFLAAELARGGRGGIVLRSLRDSDDGAVRDAHYHHGQTGLFREGGNIPPIWARARGADTVVVAITWIDEYQGILVRNESRIGAVHDLAGKRLGLPLYGNLIDFQRGAAAHAFAKALELGGIPAASVTFVDLPATQAARPGGRNGDRRSVELDALLAGVVDAIFVRHARGARLARDARVRELVDWNRMPDRRWRVNNGTPRPVTVDRPFLEQHPDLVARYLGVLLRTAAWAERHRDDVLDWVAATSGGVSREDVIAAHGFDVHRSFRPRLSADYVAGLEQQKDFLLEHGFLDDDFDVARWVAPEPLARAEEIVRRGLGASECTGEAAYRAAEGAPS